MGGLRVVFFALFGTALYLGVVLLVFGLQAL